MNLVPVHNHIFIDFDKIAVEALYSLCKIDNNELKEHTSVAEGGCLFLIG